MSGEARSTGEFTPVKFFTDPEQGLPMLEVIRERFHGLYDEYPTVAVRVPGRVNLIGEHIDYCGYSVCPLAIQYDIIVAAKPNHEDKFIYIKNCDSVNYPDCKCSITSFSIDLKSNGWASYYLCGVKGALDKLHKDPDCGMKVLVSGSIPPGSGLSSSSALVCAAFLITAHLSKICLPKFELASLCAVCEQYIGTAGGGMDQAIAILAEKGCAKHIEFMPLRAKDIALPKDVAFVIANSCVVKNKAASADFNTRVVECRLASQLIAKQNYLNWKSILKLSEVQHDLNVNLEEMIKVVQGALHSEPYSKKEVCEILGVTEAELDQSSLTPNTVHVKSFLLRQRALHVFQEAKRVIDWCNICSENNDPNMSTKLGRLMTESHNSLRDLYQCSHEKLDDLVEICMHSGALGARLTGAGWGGCVVAMVPLEVADTFIKYVKEKFYGNDTENIDSLIFSTSPNQGAEIYVYN